MLTALLIANAALLALGPVGALAASRRETARRIVYGGSLLASAAATAIALVFLLGGAAAGAAESLVLPIGLPWLAAHFRLDALAALFVLLVSGVGAAASLYGLDYGRHEAEPSRVLPFFPVFLAGLGLVPLADDAFAFLVSWEFMSLSSWLLVLSAHRDEAARGAAHIYLIMAAFSTMALLLAFGVLAGVPGDYSFAAIRARDLSPTASGFVMVLLLLGAGAKAGLVPLQAWLPLAHPAAPSHVSALMSGAMTKIAVYAFVRVTFDLLDHSDWWWGVAVIVLGAVTAVLGILYALFQRDLKTLLAYSTVENIGIIFTAIGLSLAFRANSLTFLAGLALVAALLHAVNHAIFKSLLFFGAGAVLVAAGQRDIERLGGLIHRMPATAPLFLIGCAAISALPPLNGFVSEWLVFQAVLNGPELPQWALKFAVPVAGALLALTAALAAACFVRAFGIVFLGRARSADALAAREVEPRMRAAMALLATLCVVIGVLPVAALSLLTPVVESLTGFPPLAESRVPWLVLAPVADRASSYSGAIVLLMIALFGAVVVAVVRRASEAATRRTPAWDCGFPDQPASAQYSASSFTQPLRRVFGSSLFRARETVEMPEPGDPSAARFELRLKDPIWDGFYEPIAMLLRWGTDRINVLQFLTIRRYLALMFAALVVLLLLVVVLR